MLDVVKRAEIIGISPIVLGKLLGGFESGTKTKKNREELQGFLSSSWVRFYPVTLDTPSF